MIQGGALFAHKNDPDLDKTCKKVLRRFDGLLTPGGQNSVNDYGMPYFVHESFHFVLESLFLLKPRACGDEKTSWNQSSWDVSLFYVPIYIIALGNGANIATFGADQFDEEDVKEGHSKVSFFSYFYLALNLGELFSITILGYFEDEGIWVLGFWASIGSAFVALLLFLGAKNWKEDMPAGEVHNLYEEDGYEKSIFCARCSTPMVSNSWTEQQSLIHQFFSTILGASVPFPKLKR
ncbi:unnamed protein product [Fraxinus pennsylvanica]|uniref:Uncharacterized protein n=1 Tax=Fraxinus pennsylvanica TaxID=56036 RepID=A0AAD2A976_9LAMI|nr:unnamed protein product [Fraxinus pennsylvanica]